MVHINAAEYTHNFAHSNWRILIQDDHNDVVITWQHKRNEKGKIKWIGMGHLDQTCHATYHAHMSEGDNSPIDIASNLTNVQKLEQGLLFLKTKAQAREIYYGNDYLAAEDVHMELKALFLEKIAPKGKRANSVSITATAAITTTPPYKPSVDVSEGLYSKRTAMLLNPTLLYL